MGGSSSAGLGRNVKRSTSEKTFVILIGEDGGPELPGGRPGPPGALGSASAAMATAGALSFPPRPVRPLKNPASFLSPLTRITELPVLAHRLDRPVVISA